MFRISIVSVFLGMHGFLAFNCEVCCPLAVTASYSLVFNVSSLFDYIQSIILILYLKNSPEQLVLFLILPTIKRKFSVCTRLQNCIKPQTHTHLRTAQ